MTTPSHSQAGVLLDCFDQHHTTPAQRDHPLTDMAAAVEVQDQIVARRRLRGEHPRGYKIGFTNRSIWPLYNVFHPIWGPVYDTTLQLLDSPQASIAISPFLQPRLEPEVVFGLRATPRSDEPGDLVDAIDWYAQGFEVVQSVYPDWKFTAAEAFAAQALHGALLVGPRRPLTELADPVVDLAALTLGLNNQGRRIADGHGALVLDSPVLALGYLVRELARVGRQLHAGDVITTGTLTDAQPMSAGQLWTVDIQGAPLHGITLTVTD
jgi:2-keto-4-pentenoate hydratase